MELGEFYEDTKIIYFFMILNKLVKVFKFLSPKESEKLMDILSRNGNVADVDLKLKIHSLLTVLKKEIKKSFGMIVVFGWQKKWNRKYAAFPDITQNIFKRITINLRNNSHSDIAQILKRTLDFDGAILIDEKGNFSASGVYLTNIAPNEVAKILYSSAVDLSTAFGFKKKVHMRHLAGIAASYILKGTTVFVLSEEDGSLLFFENGKIVWSTVNGEAIGDRR